MTEIAVLIDRVLKSPDDAGVKSEVREQVRALTKMFPLYA
jgi:glycine/serine hydroxymethyltransferase